VKGACRVPGKHHRGNSFLQEQSEGGSWYWGGTWPKALPVPSSQNYKVCESREKPAFPEKHSGSKLEVSWKGVNPCFKKCMLLSLAPSVLDTEKGNIHLRGKKNPGHDLANCKMQRGAGWERAGARACLARSKTSALPVKGLTIPIPFRVFLAGCSQVIKLWAWLIPSLVKKHAWSHC